MVSCPSMPENTREPEIRHGNYTSCILARSPFFTVEMWKGEGEQVICQPHPFMIIDLLEGQGTINGQRARKGDHLIATAGCESLRLEGSFHLVASWV